MIKRWYKRVIGIALAAVLLVNGMPADVVHASEKNVYNIKENVVEDIVEDSDDEKKSEDRKTDAEIKEENLYEEGENLLESLSFTEDHSGLRNYIPSAEDYTSVSAYDNMSESEELRAEKYNEALPEKYDVRDEIDIPVVRNQSPYGSCWAHSTMTLAEINLIKKGIADSSIDLSEMQTAVFAYTNVADPLGGIAKDEVVYGGSDSYINVGGNINFAKAYLAGWKGVVDEAQIPYGLTSDFQSSIAETTKYAFSNDTFHVQGVRNADIVNEPDVVKQLIREYGAVSASYCDEDKYYSETYNSYYHNIVHGTNHAITVIGWDDTFPKENFVTPASKDGAWLIRNSWGSNAEGHSGYFWLSYDDKSLGVNVVALDVELADNYDNNYQYDGSWGTGSVLYTGSAVVYGANIFTAHAKDNDENVTAENVKAVSFETYESNIEYEVSVYTNIQDGSNPISGTLADTVSGTTKQVGYYTVPLSKSIQVEEGEKYSVVLKLQYKEGETAHLPIETEYSIVERNGDEEITIVSTNYGLNAGESFTSEDGEEFDEQTDKNVKIKAFTDNVYKTEKYSINYVVNYGGVFGIDNNDNPNYYYETSDDIILKAPVARLSSSVFDGWYSDSELTQKVIVINKGTTGDITLYAKWKSIEFTTGDCSATLDQFSALTVSGAGATGSYSAKTDLPWHDYADTIKTIIIEDGVTQIGENFGTDYARLEYVVIPRSVTQIAKSAFAHCKKLETIEYNAVSAEGQSIFYNGYSDSLKDRNRTLIIGPDVETIGLNAFNKAELCHIVWPEVCKVTAIRGHAFEGVQYFELLDIPASVTSIGEYAFKNNSNIQTIRFLGNPTIADNAFSTDKAVETSIMVAGEDTNIKSYNWASSNRTAEYVDVQYRVIYELDGGVNDEENPEWVKPSDEITLKNPAKDGYMFKGFYLNSDFSGEIITRIEAGTAKDIVLYAKWEKCDHSESTEKATCTESATCSICGDTIPATGHSLSEWTVTKEPTCYEAGTKERKCQNTGCTYSETEEIKKLEHSLTEWTVTKEPTCYEAGTKERKCQNTGCTYSETEEIKKLEHSLTEWTVTKEPTCYEAGTKERKCQNTGCTYSETEEIKKLEHSLTEWKVTKEPTCTEDGEESRNCTNKGCTYEETEIIKAKGHKMGEWVVVKKPTVTEEGEKKRECLVCTYTETESIPVIAQGFQVVFNNEDYVYYNPNGAVPEYTVYYNGEELKPLVDYKVSYKNNKKVANKDASVAPAIVISGMGRFSGSYTCKYTIKEADFTALSYSSEITLTKKTALKPLIYDNGILLKESDYDIYKMSGHDKIKIKSGDKLTESCELLISGKKNYTGDIYINANVVEALGNKISVNQSYTKLYYTGTELFPEITVVDSKNKSNVLIENEDYIVHLPGDTFSAGSHTYIVEGIGEYSGTVTKKYTIYPKAINKDDIEISYDTMDLVYNSFGVELQNVTVSANGIGGLTKDVDYTLKYTSNKKATAKSSKAKCTISFIGNYKGTKAQTILFNILPYNFADGDTKVIVPDKTMCADNKVIKSTPIVDVNGVKLSTSDYTVKYYLDSEMHTEMSNSSPVIFDETRVKTVYVKITGTGNYAGNAYGEYNVYAKDYATKYNVTDISKAKITVVTGSYDPEYNGEYKEPDIKITPSTIEVVKENCYYSNNVYKGTATVMYKGDGVKTIGTVTKTFKITAKSIKK